MYLPKMRNSITTRWPKKEGKVKLDDVLTTELSEQITLLKNDVANGAMTADVANKNLQTWSQERFKGLENDLPMHARLDLQNYWSQNVAKNATSFLPLQLVLTTKKVKCWLIVILRSAHVWIVKRVRNTSNPIFKA